jgi:hypothetical protein
MLRCVCGVTGSLGLLVSGSGECRVVRVFEAMHVPPGKACDDYTKYDLLCAGFRSRVGQHQLQFADWRCVCGVCGGVFGAQTGFVWLWGKALTWRACIDAVDVDESVMSCGAQAH